MCDIHKQVSCGFNEAQVPCHCVRSGRAGSASERDRSMECVPKRQLDSWHSQSVQLFSQAQWLPILFLRFLSPFTILRGIDWCSHYKFSVWHIRNGIPIIKIQSVCWFIAWPLWKVWRLQVSGSPRSCRSDDLSGSLFLSVASGVQRCHLSCWSFLS